MSMTLDEPTATSRLTPTFARLEATGEKALMAGYVPGDPDLELGFEIGRTILENGADFLEFSLSFSDPVADGPTLQAAHQRTLAAGVTKRQVFDLIGRLRSEVAPHQPFVVLEYANCAYQLGLDYFYGELAWAGVDSVILIDLPIEEGEEFVKMAGRHKLNQTFVVAPSSSPARVKEIVARSQEWIYMVSLLGTTGSRASIDERAFSTLSRVREATDLPILTGFGISRPDQLQQMVRAGATGVVTCSAVVDLLYQHRFDPTTLLRELATYVREMKRATYPDCLPV
jgi:tryptophan synthase alpha chain